MSALDDATASRVLTPLPVALKYLALEVYFLPEKGSFTCVPTEVEQPDIRRSNTDKKESEKNFIIQFYEKYAVIVPHKNSRVTLP